MISNFDDEIANFPYELLQTNRQVSNRCKAFANIKLSETQLSKIMQSGGFLGRLLGPLLKTGLPLMKTVLQPLAKRVLIPLGLSAVTSSTDSGSYKKNFRLWYPSDFGHQQQH